AAQTGRKPFFLFLNFMEAHRPWMSGSVFRARYPSYDQAFDEMKILSFSREVLAGSFRVPAQDAAKMHAAYDGSIAYLDHVVGGLLDRLKRQPWYDSSLIVITSDHGELFGEHDLLDHGNSVGQELTSIPMIVKFPGQNTRREVQSPVSQVDVFSTIAAAAGVEQPANIRGVDLALGDPGERRTIVMESYPFINYTSVNPKMNRLERGLVKGRWKMIQSNRGRRDLYDMVSDPRESKNLWSSNTDVALEMDGLLRDWVTRSTRQRPVTRVIPQERNLLRRLKALGYAQ
ncbi:MAG TPA: sulfatase-like hydrolase/transferase, partial [Bryobacteraceae bacterium]|nr:sulfatase-like hydrolase/transferase [Bryobacteraceae bacterium]